MFIVALFKMSKNWKLSKCTCTIEMYTWIVVEIPRSGVLYGNKSEQTKTTYSKLYKPHAHGAEQKMPGINAYI